VAGLSVFRMVYAVNAIFYAFLFHPLFSNSIPPLK
jgi:hypothetical protein